MSLSARLRGTQPPAPSPPSDPKTVLDEHYATELDAARIQIARLEMHLADAHAATRWANNRAAKAEQAAQELRVAAAGGAVAARATLYVYEGRPSPIDCPRACCAPAPTGASA